jgi:hypothetical protein
MLLERVSDILGGIPFIIVATLFHSQGQYRQGIDPGRPVLAFV